MEWSILRSEKIDTSKREIFMFQNFKFEVQRHKYIRWKEHNFLSRTTFERSLNSSWVCSYEFLNIEIFLKMTPEADL